MDPETARAVAQISSDATRTAAAAGVLGVLLGGALGILGQLLLSSRTLKHQRVLARDEAVRKWRVEQVLVPFVQAAYRRLGVLQETLNAVGQVPAATDLAEQATWRAEIQRLYTQLHREQQVTNVADRAVQLEWFKRAVAALSTADTECTSIIGTFMPPAEITEDNARRLESALAGFTTALVAATSQCEQYVGEDLAALVR